MENSLFFLKRDFLEEELHWELFKEIKENEITVMYSFLITLSLDDVKEFYGWETLYNVDLLLQYWCNIELPVIVTMSENAISKNLYIKKKIRKSYPSNHEMYTRLHCPDSKEDYERDLEFLLKKRLR